MNKGHRTECKEEEEEVWFSDSDTEQKRGSSDQNAKVFSGSKQGGEIRNGVDQRDDTF